MVKMYIAGSGRLFASDVVTFGVGALMALTKSKKHFVGLTWDYNGNNGGFAFQADKGNTVAC